MDDLCRAILREFRRAALPEDKSEEPYRLVLGDKPLEQERERE